MTEKKKSLWSIPLSERFILTTTLGHQEYMELDGIGFLLEYNKKHRDSMSKKDYEDFIRHHLVGERETECIIEAESADEARKIFESQWDGAKCGTKSKALWIDEKYHRKIEKIPDCPIRHKNNRGEYICGEQTEDSEYNGEFGMCAVEHYDLPDGECPLKGEND